MYTYYVYFGNVFVNVSNGAVTVHAHSDRSVAGVTTRIRVLDGRNRLFLMSMSQDMYQQQLDGNYWNDVWDVRQGAQAQLVFYFGGSEVASTGYFPIS